MELWNWLIKKYTSAGGPSLSKFLNQNPRTLVLGYDHKNGYVTTPVDKHMGRFYQ